MPAFLSAIWAFLAGFGSKIFGGWIGKIFGGWFTGLTSWTNVFKIAVILTPICCLLAFWLYTSGMRSDYKDMSYQIAGFQQQKRVLDARVNSYQRMIERRNEAIDASQCKDQIRKWIHNPDLIPKKFDPHNQFTPPMYR